MKYRTTPAVHHRSEPERAFGERLELLRNPSRVTITYQLKDKQYVARTSGVVSGFFGGNGTSTMIIFALP